MLYTLYYLEFRHKEYIKTYLIQTEFRYLYKKIDVIFKLDLLRIIILV